MSCAPARPPSPGSAARSRRTTPRPHRTCRCRTARSDAALVFDPTTGLFDASLAAAWTIGRLIALQDKAFSAALYTWKRGLTQAMVNAAERELIAEALGDRRGRRPDEQAAAARHHAAACPGKPDR